MVIISRNQEQNSMMENSDVAHILTILHFTVS